MFSLRLDKNLFSKVNERADIEHKSNNSVIVSAIEEYMLPAEVRYSPSYHSPTAGMSGSDLKRWLERVERLEHKVEKISKSDSDDEKEPKPAKTGTDS